MSFRPEPQHAHGTPEKTAILVVNLGTPEAPTAQALKPYLRQFLSDRRVVEIPRALWWFILNGLIVPLRSAQSAKKYAAVWLPDGSPLKVWTTKQTALLRGLLGHRGHDVMVEYAMRYGQPSIADVLDQLKAAGCTRILVLPLYPQYAAATTASAQDAIQAWCATVRNLPELRFIKHYHDDPGYIGALAASIQSVWERDGRALWSGERRPDARLVLSFHGVPRRTLDLGDPYHCECQKTGRLLAEALDLPPEQVVVSFQSRFGKAEWLQPYTAPTLARLAKEGVRTVDILCPGFPADCLETLEEIAIEGRQTFLQAGGQEYRYIPCLNDRPEWIAALGDIAEQHLQGWPTQRPLEADRLARELEMAEQRRRAQAKGVQR